MLLLAACSDTSVTKTNALPEAQITGPDTAAALLTVHDLYPSKEALDAASASGSTEGMPAQLEQLDALVATLDATSTAAG
jgi:hypothetical protein